MTTMRARFALVALALTVALIPTTAAGTATAAPGDGWCTEKARLAVLGDSGSTGYGSTGWASQDDTYAPTTYGWYTHTANNLKAAYGTTGVNYAHNGAMVSDFQPGGRWPSTTGAVAQLGQQRPNLVLVELGGNEYLSGVSPATFEANLRKLVGDIRTATPGADIVFVNIWRIARSTPYPWSDYGSAMYRVAVSMGTGLVDLRQSVPDSDATPPAAGLYFTDNAHLADAGQLVVAGVIWSWLVTAC